MVFKHKSFHNIDLDRNEVLFKSIPTDFEPFIEDYVRFAATENKDAKQYKVRNVEFTVARSIADIIMNCINDGSDSDRYATAIAEKLLHEEELVQRSIMRLDQHVQRGSIMQAAIQEDDNNWQYVIAKVEHTEFYSEATLVKNYGWASERKSVWKSAVFQLYVTGDAVEFIDVKVYVDHKASYWADKFLELDEIKRDEDNTRISYTTADSLLKSLVNKKSPRDYEHLHGAITTYYRTHENENINFNDMIHSLVETYVPESDEIKKDEIIAKLRELPEKKQFDTQFPVIIDAISFKKKRFYDIGNGLSIAAAGDSGDILRHIQSFEDDGRKYIRIECSNEDTYNYFMHRAN